MTARVALITGGTDGIGKATAQRLLAEGWQVILTGRSRPRCDATVQELKEATGRQTVSALVGDLFVMADIQRLAHEARALTPSLELLILNANSIIQERVLTPEGFESNLAIGYLGRILLARLLEPLLQKASNAQILTVVGLDHQRINFDDLMLEREFTARRGLMRWQWAMQVHCREWNRRSPVPMNVFMPGLVKTKILANEPQPMRLLVQILNLFVGLPVEKSAGEVADVVRRVTEQRLRDAYFYRSTLKPPRDLKEQPGDGQRLWETSEGLLAPFLTP